MVNGSVRNRGPRCPFMVRVDRTYSRCWGRRIGAPSERGVPYAYALPSAPLLVKDRTFVDDTLVLGRNLL